jgi:hypothetical protein
VKTLIAVVSYFGDSDRGSHQAIRDTWGQDAISAGFDLRFFIGRRSPGWTVKSEDEILLDEKRLVLDGDPDDHEYWQSLIDGILRWSIEQNYEFTFVCCNDTFIIPHKLMACGFEKYDYSGQFVPIVDFPLGMKSTDEIYGHNLYLWADAGVGWFVSKRAAEFVILGEKDGWPFDIHVGQVLGPIIGWGCLRAATIPGFWDNISYHYRFATGIGYNPECGWQKEMHERHKND